MKYPFSAATHETQLDRQYGYRVGVLASLAPDCAETDELWGDLGEEDVHPQEALLVAKAVVTRRREFLAGRACAHRALRRLDIPEGPLLANPDRSPNWPSGVVGSITHTAGFCGAAVAQRTHLRGIGIDAERLMRVTPDLWRLIFTAHEQDWLASVAASERDMRATIMFSAKEAFYKAQFSVTGAWLGFQDAEVELCSSHYRIGMRRAHAHLPKLCDVRVWTGCGLAVTLVAID